MLLKRIVGYWVLKFIGWSFDRDFDFKDKQVVIGFPHTSNIDGVRALFMFPLLGIDAHFLIKRELFRWPFSPVLRYMGGIPVMRSQHGNQVDELAQQFRQQQKFTLVITPEGTRTKDPANVPVIKTGFWFIARQARVPIVLLMADEIKNHGSFLGAVMPTDNLNNDLLKIQEIYRDNGVTVRLPELSKPDL